MAIGWAMPKKVSRAGKMGVNATAGRPNEAIRSYRQQPQAKRIRVAPSVPKTKSCGVIIIAAADQGTPDSKLMPGGGYFKAVPSRRRKVKGDTSPYLSSTILMNWM